MMLTRCVRYLPASRCPRVWPRILSSGERRRYRSLRSASAWAFTLIELVISAALMAVILVAGYACLSAGMSSRALVEERADLMQHARVALAQITADLRSACPLDKQAEFIGMDRMIEDVEADNLDFATHHYTPRRAGEGDFCEVSYFVEKNPRTGEFSLWRRLDTFPDAEPLAGGSREEILRGLSGVSFSYYDGLEWFDEWGDPNGRSRGGEPGSLLQPNNLSGMPDAVKITLSLPSRSPSRRADTATAEQEASPLMLQTIVCLNLAPISAERSSGNGSTSISPASGGNQSSSQGGNR